MLITMKIVTRQDIENSLGRRRVKLRYVEIKFKNYTRSVLIENPSSLERWHFLPTDVLPRATRLQKFDKAIEDFLKISVKND